MILSWLASAMITICARHDRRRRRVRRHEGGAVFVDHTTASAEIARELDAEATKRGFKFVDARCLAVRPARKTAR